MTTQWLPFANAQRPSEDATSLLQEQHDLLRNELGLAPHDALDGMLGVLAGWSECVHAKSTAGDRPSVPSVARVLKARDRVLSTLSSGDGTSAASFKHPLPQHVVGRLIDGLGLALFASNNRTDLLGRAVMSFIDGTLRRQLGAFFTPKSVIDAMAACANITDRDVVLDPACGAGGFLRAAAKFAPRVTLLGVDRDVRSVLVTRLALARHEGMASVERGDFLTLEAGSRNPATVVLTNPPFGVRVASDPNGEPSEIRFIEHGLQSLSEGGRLWIVVPRSVLSNRRLATARARIDATATLRTVIELPPETFVLTGTNVATAILELVKGRVPTIAAPSLLRVRNVGHDETGRSCSGEDISSVATRRVALMTGAAGTRDDRPLRTGTGLASLFDEGNDRASGGELRSSGVSLGELCTSLATGFTPPRAAYAADGHFVVKVGNLRGHGIDWTPRTRNHIASASGRRLERTTVEEGDILLTAAAHHARYVGLKVDLVTSIPRTLKRPVLFSAEVMRLRIDPARIDPVALYLWLRSRGGYERIQRLVRGQTAHLYPDDVRELIIDLEAIKRAFPPSTCAEARACLVAEQKLQDRWRALETECGLSVTETDDP